jgi:hypothetical protein
MAREDKIKELAKALIKAQRDEQFGRIEKIPYTQEVERITKEGKLVNIDPNEILTRAMQNADKYEKVLTKETGLPYDYDSFIKLSGEKV